MRRLPILVFALVLFAPTSAAVGQVVETCTFDEETATVTVVPASGLAHLEVVNGDEIWEGSTPCGAATTTTTDLIEIQPALGDRVEISLQGGPFAPGLTDEGEASEIEFSVLGTLDTFLELAIVGSDGDDYIRAGTGPQPLARSFVDDSQIDLDAGSGVQDVDIVVAKELFAHLELSLGDGADRVSLAGARTGVDQPFLGSIDVDAGPGDDRVDPVSIATPALGDLGFSGGDGNDSLQLSWLGDACSVVLDTSWVDGSGLIEDCTYAGEFPLQGFERFVGHGGDDMILGDALGEEIEGRNGDDLIVPAGGADLLDGGGGTDKLLLGHGSAAPIRVRVDLGLVFGDGATPGVDHFEDFEEVVSEGTSVDRFVGVPTSGRLRRIRGSADGADIVDLRQLSYGVTLYSWNFPSFGHLAQGMWVDRVIVLGTPFADRFETRTHTPHHEVFRGLEGDDILRGGAGPDDLRGGPGDDEIDGGTGIDTCSGGAGNDVLTRCERS